MAVIKGNSYIETDEGQVVITFPWWLALDSVGGPCIATELRELADKIERLAKASEKPTDKG